MTEPSLYADRPRQAAVGLSPEVLTERRGDNWWEQDLRVPEQLDCWPGHFPGRPILPGVAEIAWVVDRIDRWVSRPVFIHRFEALKFTRPIEPGFLLTLRLERPGPALLRFRLFDDTSIFSSGRVILAEGPGCTR